MVEAIANDVDELVLGIGERRRFPHGPEPVYRGRADHDDHEVACRLRSRDLRRSDRGSGTELGVGESYPEHESGLRRGLLEQPARHSALSGGGRHRNPPVANVQPRRARGIRGPRADDYGAATGSRSSPKPSSRSSARWTASSGSRWSATRTRTATDFSRRFVATIMITLSSDFGTPYPRR